MNNVNIERQAEQTFKKYKPFVEAYEKKAISGKVLGKVGVEEIAALGKKLEQFENFVRFSEAEGAIGDLGVIPRIGLSVITAAQAVDPTPLMASVQVIPEEMGSF